MQSQWARDAVAHVDPRCAGEPLARHHRITFNFHPDRGFGGVEILEAMLADGEYRSQFVTGTSNGGLTAHIGGDRWRWEQSLFGGAYDEAPAGERPKYGALNHRYRTLGGAPRFGSAHLRLKEHMLDRATFCFPDSALSPARFATARRFGLWDAVTHHEESMQTGDNNQEVLYDPLDGYVEAQVHGRVLLDQDVEALVLDPCFRATPVERRAQALGLPIEWHEGRVLHTDVLQHQIDYRGGEPVRIGLQIAERDLIDARIIGDAVRTGRFEVQPMKQLWHLTAQWGSPAGSADLVRRRVGDVW